MFVPREIDWEAVSAYYAVGHTRSECRARFGFSNDAWARAVDRGEIVPRARAEPRPSEKRAAVATLRAQGLSYVEIARRLGLTKSTVAYHARRACLPADERFAKRYDWSVVQRAIDDEKASMRECMRRFGFSRDAWGKAVQRGDIVPREWRLPLDEVLAPGRKRSRGHVKKRLLRAGLKEDRCERCGINEWRGEKLSLHLHHINGDGHDNRLENLELLCPNCHSQTDTYGGRNGHRRVRRHRA